MIMKQVLNCVHGVLKSLNLTWSTCRNSLVYNVKFWPEGGATVEVSVAIIIRIYPLGTVNIHCEMKTKTCHEPKCSSQGHL